MIWLERHILVFTHHQPRDLLFRAFSFISFFVELQRVALIVQGDHSGCVKPPVDIKTKVPF